MALGTASDFSSLTDRQANQSVSVGNVGARLADPFMNERPQYQNALSKLVSDPGSFSSSPFYKFAYDEGLNALSRKGNVRSGNKLAALMQYGQDRASQSYFPQAQLLAGLATQGSSPTAAAMSTVGGYNRSQDQRQIAAAQGAPRAGSGTVPFWNDPNTFATQDAERARLYGSPNASGSSLPSGGYGGYSGYGQPSYSGYGPSSGGTGYVSSDYGTYNFGSPAGGDSFYTPSYGGYNDYAPTYDYSGYGGYEDAGYGGDYNDYSYDY